MSSNPSARRTAPPSGATTTAESGSGAFLPPVPAPTSAPTRARQRAGAPALRAIYSPEDAATYLSVSRAQLYRWMTAGRLHGFRAGRLRRFSRAELDAFAAELEAEGQAS